MCVASGDQHGSPLTAPSSEVNDTGLAPSRSAIQSSKKPDRFEMKAMRRLSGEKCGITSTRVETSKGLDRASP